MTLEHEQLDNLDIGDVELQIILDKIEKIMNKEDTKLETCFQATHVEN
jgi:hypothetical protein